MRLSDVADSRDNNFDVLRLFAASIVLVSHSFFLAGQQDPVGTLDRHHARVARRRPVLRHERLPDPQELVVRPLGQAVCEKRILRIMPALWVVIALTTFVLGPIVTELPLTEYLSDPGTWSYWCWAACS